AQGGQRGHRAPGQVLTRRASTASPRPDAHHTPRGVPTMSATATFTVSGMTCGHCVASVKEEVSEIPGVSSVEVDLETGRLVDAAAVRDAVDEAGYTVTAEE